MGCSKQHQITLNDSLDLAIEGNYRYIGLSRFITFDNYFVNGN
jgi:hypothetical protein